MRPSERKLRKWPSTGTHKSFAEKRDRLITQAIEDEDEDIECCPICDFPLIENPNSGDTECYCI